MSMLSYTYPVSSLFTGLSLWNRFAFAQLDEQTNVKGLWSSTDDQFYLGEWTVDIILDGTLLHPHETVFAPESQTTRLVNGEGSAERQFYLPFAETKEALTDVDGLRRGVYLVRLLAGKERSSQFIVRHSLLFPAVPSPKFIKKPPLKQTQKHVKVVDRENHIEITTLDAPREARV